MDPSYINRRTRAQYCKRSARACPRRDGSSERPKMAKKPRKMPRNTTHSLQYVTSFAGGVESPLWGDGVSRGG